MRYWTAVFAVLLGVPVDAYVKNWATNEDPTDTLQRLQGRADTCPSDHPVSCKSVDSKLPSTFCCKSDNVCLSVDKSSTAICCPKGGSCDNINPINCDISLQDASKNTGPIYTTKTGKLPTCGNACCPFGYQCTKSGGVDVCAIVKGDAGPATTITSKSTTVATITTSPTAVGIDSTNPPPKQENTTFPVGVFFAGVFPGILVGVLATLAWVVFTKRNNKPQDTRGLNIDGHGARPFISNPMKDARQSNERSDFLGRTRSRARSMFSTYGQPKIVNTPEIWGSKMPTPPPISNIPVHYVNDMPDVPVTPARRVARYASDPDLSHVPRNENYNFASITPDVSDPNRPETIRVYSPELTQELQKSHMPIAPSAAVPPLRAMNTQRRISPDYGSIPPRIHKRHDSGTAMGFGSPFQTPEKKPVVAVNTTPSMYATYHDAATDNSIPMLTPARYEPTQHLAPSAAANLAASRLSEAQQSLPSQQGKPALPPRSQRAPEPRPETQYSEFDFDEELDNQDVSPVQQSPPREAYKSQAVLNPYNQHAQGNARVNLNATFDSMIPAAPSSQFDKKRTDNRATNMTTFTTMLKDVGMPDPGNQVGVPAMPKLDMKKVKGRKNNMI